MIKGAGKGKKLAFFRNSGRWPAIALLAALQLGCNQSAPRIAGPTAPPLPEGEPFAALAATILTNAGASTVIGDLGIYPGVTLKGFPPGKISGTPHVADSSAQQAQWDAAAAYDFIAAQPCDVYLTGQDLGTRTLTPAVYCTTLANAQLTGTLTLDAGGDPNALFVFQIAGTLATAPNSSVVVRNGASPCRVFWQVGASATLGAASQFAGTLIGLADITLANDVTVNGRVLARSGALTLSRDHIDLSACAGPSHSSDGDAGNAATDGGTGDAAEADAGNCYSSVFGTMCENHCVNLRSDSANCGECGHACPDGLPCLAAFCGTCPGTICEGWCVDLNYDRHHCGRCGNPCGPNEACNRGTCEPLTCQGGAICSGACVNLATDSSNCGACGNVCDPLNACLGGACCRPVEQPLWPYLN